MAKTIKKTFGEGEGAQTFTFEKLKVIAATSYMASLTEKLGEPGVAAASEAYFLNEKASGLKGDDSMALKYESLQYIIGAVMRIVMRVGEREKLMDVVGPLFANMRGPAGLMDSMERIEATFDDNIARFYEVFRWAFTESVITPFAESLSLTDGQTGNES